MSRFICLMSFLCVACVCRSSGAATEERAGARQPQEMADTWVMVVAVLTYEEEGRAWTDENRQDAVLLELLRSRGVPEAQLVCLKDEDATAAAAQAAWEHMLELADPGDTVCLYFTGHGLLVDHNLHLLTYDYQAGRAAETSWPVRDIHEALDEHPDMGRVMLWADCCHSGGLLPSQVDEATSNRLMLASAHINSLSTGRWTFTECLIDAIAGAGHVDSDGDGFISFQEAGAYIECEMAFSEQQMAQIRGESAVAEDLILAPVDPDYVSCRTGVRIEFSEEGDWIPAHQVAEHQGQVTLRRVPRPALDLHDDAAGLLTIPRLRTRMWQPDESIEVGQRMECESQGQWYPVDILAQRYGLLQVRYLGWGEVWDEWVWPAERLRVPAEPQNRE